MLPRVAGASVVFALSLCADAHATEAETWRRWELVLKARSTNEDPFRVTVSAVFQGPTGQRLQAPGFYSGDGTFRFRVAFPAPGVWTWQSQCDRQESGLHGRRGTVRVRQYTGRNPLFRHGFLQVRPGARTLSHADGTPFLWMGDTAWYAGVKATEAEWKDYIADRESKRFSVVQISGVRGPAEAGWPQAFSGSGRPNGSYWESFERKVQAANNSGLVVLLVGLGRPNDPADEPRVAAPEFARYIAARFFGDHVIFSPNFDGAYVPVLDSVAENLRAATSIHLITQHPNTRQGQNQVYLPRTYLSFSGLQSGHHNGRLELTYGAAREWALSLWSATPVKPVINIEAMYDGRGNDEGAGWRERDARKLGWITWLSGALGYTYGAGESGRKVPGTNGGVWRWNQREGDADFWRKAMQWRSSRQMTVLRDFFASVEWWRLEPAHQVVLDASESNQERAVFASTPDRSVGVAYSPAGRLSLDMAYFPGPVEAVWINPATGERHRVPERVVSRAKHEFRPPELGDDWALLLRVH